VTAETQWPLWLQWFVFIGYNVVMAVLFGLLIWLMVYIGNTGGF
jgi:hypothetical protein